MDSADLHDDLHLAKIILDCLAFNYSSISALVISKVLAERKFYLYLCRRVSKVLKTQCSYTYVSGLLFEYKTVIKIYFKGRESISFKNG